METTTDEKTEWVDMMGPGIQAKNIQRGTGETADMNMVVSCNLTGYFSDDTQHLKPFEIMRDQVFVIGEMDTLPAIELTLRHSRAGDIYWLRSSYKFAFGLLGRAGVSRDHVAEEGKEGGKAAPLVQIPPEADLEYLVEVTGHYSTAAAAATAISQSERSEKSELLRSENSDVSELLRSEQSEGEAPLTSALLETLADTDLRRVCGNRWFSYGDYPKAGRSYGKGVQIAQNYFSNEPEGENEGEGEGENEPQVTEIEEGDDGIQGAGEGLGELGVKGETSIDSVISESKNQLMIALISCLNNLSPCHLSMKEYVKTKEACVRVLELEPDNVKALIRVAKASLALHEYDECALCLETLREIEPSNPSLTIEMNRLKKAKAIYAEKEKQISKNMAKKIFS